MDINKATQFIEENRKRMTYYHSTKDCMLKIHGLHIETLARMWLKGMVELFIDDEPLLAKETATPEYSSLTAKHVADFLTSMIDPIDSCSTLSDPFDEGSHDDHLFMREQIADFFHQDNREQQKEASYLFMSRYAQLMYKHLSDWETFQKYLQQQNMQEAS